MTKKKVKEETQPVPRKIRGTLEALGGDEYRFRPQGKGEAQQANVVSVGNAKMYDTVGKKPQRMVSLKVSTDATDIRSELFQQLEALTHDSKTQAEQPPKQTDDVVCLYKGEHVRLYVDEPQKLIRMYHEILMVQGVNYAREMMDAMQQQAAAFTPRRRSNKVKERFDKLPQEFTRDELKALCLDVKNPAITMILNRWLADGIIEKQGEKYVKKVNSIE